MTSQLQPSTSVAKNDPTLVILNFVSDRKTDVFITNDEDMYFAALGDIYGRNGSRIRSVFIGDREFAVVELLECSSGIDVIDAVNDMYRIMTPEGDEQVKVAKQLAGKTNALIANQLKDFFIGTSESSGWEIEDDTNANDEIYDPVVVMGVIPI